MIRQRSLDFVRRFLAPFLAVALVAACGGGDKESTPTAAAIPDGWRTFSSATFELSLPSSFVGGEPGTGTLAAGVQQLKALGQDDLAARLEAFTPNTVLQMIDGDGSAAVSVFWSSVPEGFSLSGYDLYGSLNPGASGLRLANQRTVRTGSYSAERLEMHNDAVAVDLIAYYVVKGTRLWSIVYTSSPANTPRWTSVFDQSAQSIRIP